MIFRRKFFTDKKGEKTDKEGNKKSNKLLRGAEIVGGIVAAKKGLDLFDSSYREGEITGRKKLYHGTSKKNKESILKEGLKGSKALDPDNLTNTQFFDLGKEDGRHLVYTSKKRGAATEMALNHLVRKRESPAVVNISIPYEEYNSLKRVYDNPEFTKGYRVSNKEEMKKFFRDRQTKYKIEPDPDNIDEIKKITKIPPKGLKKILLDKRSEDYWEKYSGAKGTNTTRIFEGDIDPKYIKGSESYNKNSIKEVLRYAKKYPKRFLKGVGKTTLGAGLISGGALLASGKLSKKKKNKDNKKSK